MTTPTTLESLCLFEDISQNGLCNYCVVARTHVSRQCSASWSYGMEALLRLRPVCLGVYRDVTHAKRGATDNLLSRHHVRYGGTWRFSYNSRQVTLGNRASHALLYRGDRKEPATVYVSYCDGYPPAPIPQPLSWRTCKAFAGLRSTSASPHLAASQGNEAALLLLLLPRAPIPHRTYIDYAAVYS